MENVRNRLRLEFFKKDDYKENIKQQSKLTFNGIRRSNENCDTYVFTKNEVVLDKPFYLGFAALELSKLHTYGTHYDKLQPYLRHEIILLHYIDTDAFFSSMNTKNIIKDLKNLEDIFDFSNLDENHELFSNKSNKVIGIFKKETPNTIWIEEFVCLRSKMYSFKCGDDSKKKLKKIPNSQTKHIEFEEYKKCLDGKEYQKYCNIFILRSINHEMHLQELKKINIIYIRW